MIYKFDVFLGDKDYYEFNKFHILYSPYGKKYRMIIGALFAAITLAVLVFITVTSSFLVAAISALPVALFGVLMTFLFPYLVLLILKIQMYITKKSQKTSYSQKSTIEFSDETFTETTDIGKTETKYFVIERISVTEQAIYMYMDRALAYILPTSLFESDEALGEFIDFLKTKNDKFFIEKGERNVKRHTEDNKSSTS